MAGPTGPSPMSVYVVWNMYFDLVIGKGQISYDYVHRMLLLAIEVEMTCKASE